MKIVAVTSCATGIAHSYMAAEAIKKACKKAGYEIRVEIQGAMGQEDKLRQPEIDEADAVVFANDIGIIGAERFAASKAKTIRISPHELIKRPDIVVEQVQKLSSDGGRTP